MPPAAPATLNDWLAYIEQQHTQAIELGLDRLFVVKAALNQTQTCPVIIVGGTNGKGSTCAMLEAILMAAGYRVGLYTSPHLLHYNERVRINGRPADDAALCAAFAKVEHARVEKAGEIPLTYFEFGTLGAWEVFAAEPLDAIILEVGLGGRLDAVNIYDPDCAIVTGVDLDHMDFLGDTREKIGFEKAGIFRTGKPAICGDTQAPQSLLAHAAAIGADLQLIGRDFGYETQSETRQWSWWGRSGQRRNSLAHPALRGRRQLNNASVVMAALDVLQSRLPLSMAEVRQGLVTVELSGRFQTLPGRPVTVLDVAHNPQAARVLADNLLDQGFFATTWAVCGMLRDKDIEGVFAALKGRVEHWLPCTLGGPRGASATKLAQGLRSAGENVVDEFDTVMAAYAYAKENAAENDRIVVFGSFLTVADVLEARSSAAHTGSQGS